MPGPRPGMTNERIQMKLGEDHVIVIGDASAAGIAYSS
jgi:hypothetical protein